MKNDYIEIGFIEGFDSCQMNPVAIFTTAVPDMKGQLAIKLVEKWGMVAADGDGEDSAGRQKIRLQTPPELVARACQTADLLIDQIKERGWVTEIPAPTIKERKS